MGNVFMYSNCKEMGELQQSVIGSLQHYFPNKLSLVAFLEFYECNVSLFEGQATKYQPSENNNFLICMPTVFDYLITPQANSC